MPARGATALDGVPYNIHSDVIRGALRHSLKAALELGSDDIDRVFDGTAERSPDRLRWSPPNTSVDLVIQWMAAMGLTLLPVGLAATGYASTPACWTERGAGRGVTLPILATPMSVARLRALLARRELTIRPQTPAASEQLKALGVAALATFSRRDGSSSTMVQFSFDAATRTDL